MPHLENSLRHPVRLHWYSLAPPTPTGLRDGTGMAYGEGEAKPRLNIWRVGLHDADVRICAGGSKRLLLAQQRRHLTVKGRLVGG